MQQYRLHTRRRGEGSIKEKKLPFANVVVFRISKTRMRCSVVSFGKRRRENAQSPHPWGPRWLPLGAIKSENNRKGYRREKKERKNVSLSLSLTRRCTTAANIFISYTTTKTNNFYLSFSVSSPVGYIFLRPLNASIYLLIYFKDASFFFFFQRKRRKKKSTHIKLFFFFFVYHRGEKEKKKQKRKKKSDWERSLSRGRAPFDWTLVPPA